MERRLFWIELMKRPGRVGCAVGAGTIGLGLVMYLLLVSYPWARFVDLLEGNNTVDIESVTIYDLNQKIVIDDPESAKYLTRQLRNSGGKQPGVGYSGRYLHIKLNLRRCPGSVHTDLYIPKDGTGFTLRGEYDGLLGDPKYHWIEFAEPPPELLRAALNRFQEK